jgi:maltose O-acetyltransferase
MKKIVVKIINKLNGKQNIDRLVLNGLKLGRNVHIGAHSIIDDAHCFLISIGDDCTIAPKVHILAHDASTKRHLGYTKIGKVSIGNRTFIGAGSIVLPGVNIGNDVIIGAGSLVTKDIPNDCVAVGNPAVVICTTSDYINKQREDMNKSVVYSAKGWTLTGGITEENKEEMRKELQGKIGFVE